MINRKPWKESTSAFPIHISPYNILHTTHLVFLRECLGGEGQAGSLPKYRKQIHTLVIACVTGDSRWSWVPSFGVDPNGDPGWDLVAIRAHITLL